MVMMMMMMMTMSLFVCLGVCLVVCVLVCLFVCLFVCCYPHLCTQEALLYAPMSNVGAITYDKDAVYIDMPQVHFSGMDDVADWGSDEEGARAATVMYRHN